MPATSSAPGSKPQSVKTPKPPKVKPKKPQPVPAGYATPNAIEGGAGVRHAHQQAVAVTPTGSPTPEQTAHRKQRAKARAATGQLTKRERAKRVKQIAQIAALSEDKSLAQLHKEAVKQVAREQRQLRDPEMQRILKEAQETGGATPTGLSGTTARQTAHDLDTTLKTLGDVGELALPIPAFKAAKAGQTILRGEKLLNTAAKAAKAEKAAKEAAEARKAARVAARASEASKAGKAKATAEQFSKQAIERLHKAELSAAARRQAAKTADRGARAVTSPIVAGMAASPGDVGKRTRAFIEGTVEANPAKSAATTLKAVPAAFGYGATVASTLPAAVTGNPKPLLGAAKQGLESFKALEPYVSGDPEQVKQATESGAGYVLAPLLPKGAIPIKAGAKALGKGVAKAAEKAHVPEAAAKVAKGAKAARESRPVVKVAPKRPPKMQPSLPRRAGQVIAGHGDRKKMTEIAERSMNVRGRQAAHSAKAVDKPAAKLGSPEAESLAVVMHVHGVSHEHPMEQLDAILRSHDTHPDDPHIVNERKAIEWAKKHPEIFEKKALWQTLDRMREHTEPLVTSESAKFVNQGRVAGVVPRHEMVPAAAQGLTDATTRSGAWDDVKALKAESQELTTKARENRARAKEATAARKTQLVKAAQTYDRAAKRRLEKSNDLRSILEPYSRPGSKPSPATKRIDWDAEMNQRFIENVRASRHPSANDPGFASDKTPNQMAGDLGGPQVQSAGPRAPRSKSGSAGAQDIADRSFAGFLANSVRNPHLQRGVNEFVRGVVKEFKVKIPGTDRYVVKSAREANELIADRLVDPRKYVFVPIRHVKQSIKAEKFDLAGYHTDLMDSLNTEISGLEGTPGTKYVLMKRENAAEFAAQLDPRGEGALQALGSLGTRAILGTNPAWLEAQFVNEITQSAVAVNPARTLRARMDLHRFAKSNPRAEEKFRAFAGDSPASLESLASIKHHGVPNPADAYEAYRFDRRTPVGKFFNDILHLRTLGKIDRAKTGEIRASTLAAAIDRDLNSIPSKARREVTHFFKGLAGAQDLEYQMAKSLQGLSREEQLKKWTDDPKLEKMRQKHLAYLDDVTGNWTAFSRFERKFSSWVMFYPYLRMSLRWTFSSYPRAHPIKAQLLYLLGQQNREELTKILGHEPNFYESGFPVTYGSDGNVSGVLPGGVRFGAPGGNVITETVAEGKVSNLSRALNPALQVGLGAITGVNPYTGQMAQKFEGGFGQQILDRGVAAARQLLSLPGPLRTGIGPLPELGRIGLGPQSPVSERYDQLNPGKDVRSILNPFSGQSSQNFHDTSKLSRDITRAHLGPDSEIGQLYDMVDTYGIGKTEELLKKQMQGKVGEAKALAGIPQPDSGDDPEMDKLIKLFYELKSKTSDRVKRADRGSKPKVKPKPAGNSIFGSGGKPIFDSKGSGQSIFGHSNTPVFK